MAEWQASVPMACEQASTMKERAETGSPTWSRMRLQCSAPCCGQREPKTPRNAAARLATARNVLDVVLSFSEREQPNPGSDALVRLNPEEAMRELRRRLAITSSNDREHDRS